MKLTKYVERIKNLSLLSVFVVSSAVISIAGPVKANAATVTGTSLSPTAEVAFTFDDGLTSSYTNAAPILKTYGLTGTNYVPTACIASTGTCPENQDASYMTWAQVQALQNTYGWEIGSHSVDTPCMADSALTDPADCPNPLPLTNAQIDAELVNSKTTLASYGIKATDFAPPYGDFNPNVIAQIAKYYASMKQFKNASGNTNGYPTSDYYLQDYPVEETLTPVSAIETAINNAITNKQFLVLTFHDILPLPSKNPDDFQYGSAELTQIASYVRTKVVAGLIQSVHVNQGLVTSSTNLLANGNFSAGISGGWTTDAPGNITADASGNGSYPDPTNSIKVVSGTKSVHLFSPKVSVTPGTTYIMKNYLSVQSIASGEVGYYIDEYDANGNWISGQWKHAENSVFSEDMNFTYKPSSAKVSKASLQIYATANPGITAYLANAQMFPESSSVAPTNLLPNGSFSAGLTSSWTTDDPADIQANSAGNGSPSNPTYSISLASSTTSKNGHLFSPKIAVASTHTYSITSWLNLKQIGTLSGGEIGYYVDEYNSSGQWVSGQYITGVHSVGAGNVGFTYTPSSTSVASASLQIIVVGNAGIQAYVTDVTWLQN